jgi:hypothetical protein
MIIPNVDGNYKTRDGKIKVTVTRKEITFEFEREPEYNIIGEEPKKKSGGGSNEVGEKILEVVKYTNKILMG